MGGLDTLESWMDDPIRKGNFLVLETKGHHTWMQTIRWATSSPVRTWIYLLDHQPSPVKEWWNCLFKPRQYHGGTQTFNKKVSMPIHPCTLLLEGKEKSGSVDSLLEPPSCSKKQVGWFYNSCLDESDSARRQTGRDAGEKCIWTCPLRSTSWRLVSQIRSSRLVLGLACSCFWRTLLAFPKKVKIYPCCDRIIWNHDH